MPKIPEYISPVDHLNPDMIGPEALARAGREINSEYNRAGSAVEGGLKSLGQGIDNHEYQQESAQLTAGFTEAYASLGDAWNKTTAAADPNDPKSKDLGQNFLDTQVRPTIDKLGENISTTRGKALYTELSAKFHAGFFQKTAAGQAKLDGDAVITALDRTQNLLSNTVYKDPSSYTGAAALIDQAAEALVSAHPNVPKAEIYKVRDQIHRSVAYQALTGLSEQNPAAAKEALKSGQFDEVLKGSDTEKLSNYADRQARAQFTAQRQADAQAKKQRTVDMNTEVNGLTSQVVQPDGSVKLPPNYFSGIAQLEHKYPEQPPGVFRAALSYGQKVLTDQQKGRNPTTDPSTFEDFRSRATLSPSDPHALTNEEVYQAAADGKLSNHDFTFFHGWVANDNRNPQKVQQQKQLDRMLSGYKQYLTKSNAMNVDAYGNQKYYEWSRDVSNNYWDQISKGAKPEDLLDPRSKNFVGKDISHYQLTPEQSLQGQTQQAGGVLQPLKPTAAPATKWDGKESMDDLAKRLGGH